MRCGCSYFDQVTGGICMACYMREYTALFGDADVIEQQFVGGRAWRPPVKGLKNNHFATTRKTLIKLIK